MYISIFAMLISAMLSTSNRYGRFMNPQVIVAYSLADVSITKHSMSVGQPMYPSPNTLSVGQLMYPSPNTLCQLASRCIHHQTLYVSWSTDVSITKHFMSVGQPMYPSPNTLCQLVSRCIHHQTLYVSWTKHSMSVGQTSFQHSNQ